MIPIDFGPELNHFRDALKKIFESTKKETDRIVEADRLKVVADGSCDGLCGECYGTGYYRGMGKPCSKGCGS